MLKLRSHRSQLLKRMHKPKGASSFGIVILLAVVVGLGAMLVLGSGYGPIRDPLTSGGVPATPIPGSSQIVVTTTPAPGQQNLQLRTFTIVTLTPAPTPSTANDCEGDKFNEEPDIFLASDPPSGGIAAAGGQINVWVDDGNGGSMAPDSVVDPNTGQITTPGDRTASDGKGRKASSSYNYYLWEPALYLTQITAPGQPGPFAGDAEMGGTPHFPVIVKGEVSLADTGNSSGFLNLPPIDPPRNVVAGRKGHGGHIAQFVWDVNAIKAAGSYGPGFYRVQIVVHDGDGDLAVNCTTIQL